MIFTLRLKRSFEKHERFRFYVRRNVFKEIARRISGPRAYTLRTERHGFRSRIDMSVICESDVTSIVGQTDRLIVEELLRTGATRLELQCAHAFVKGPARGSVFAYDALSRRMQRLVDLLAVSSVDAADLSPVSREEGVRYRAA